MCDICCLGNTFHSSSAELWLDCDTCQIHLHYNCARALNCPKICTCSVSSLLLGVSEDNFSVRTCDEIVKWPASNILRNPSKVPYVLHWSTSDVVNAFKHLHFEEEAVLFSVYKIDGFKLLQLTADELCNSFGFKRRPALKIAKIIKCFRYRVLKSSMVMRPSPSSTSPN